MPWGQYCPPGGNRVSRGQLKPKGALGGHWKTKGAIGGTEL